MTMIETETISCPSCNLPQQVDVYQTINAIENPELVKWLFDGDINIFKCNECGHEAHVQLPLLYNDYRIGVKIQYYPEQLLKENPEAVCNDYLGMLIQMKKFRQDFPFMEKSNKPASLLVVFSMAEMVRHIKFRTKLFEVENSGEDGKLPAAANN